MRVVRVLLTIAVATAALGSLSACQSAGSGVSTYSGLGIKSLSSQRANAKRRAKRRSRPVVAKMPPEKLDKLIAKHAKEHGVPVKLARAVVQVESNYNPNARGAVGEVGLMQLRPQTARGMGYKGSMKKLHNPDTNLAYGMKYLGEAYRRGGKTTCGTILKYNAGHYAKRMNKTSARYCKKVKTILKSS